MLGIQILQNIGESVHVLIDECAHRCLILDVRRK